MAFEHLKLEIAVLMKEMVNTPQDGPELALQIRGQLNTMKAEGMPLPADLLKLEEQLEKDYGV